MDERLGKTEKLKSTKEIDKLFTEGRSLKAFPFKLIYTSIPVREDGELLKTGFSVPKRLVKKAVDRNRIKRLMREVFRKNKYLVKKELSEPHAFMFVYIHREEMNISKLNESMIMILEKFQQKLK